ncbi:MAG TPA: hypothetical protein DCQ79_12000, partial [Rhizobiales bacterium]|nr:hypothetical protein [Hyphomicrobiales bacterium]
MHLVAGIVVARSGKTVLCSILVVLVLACTLDRDAGIAAEHTTEPPQPAAKVEIIYLGKSYNEPEHLSLIDKVLT